jgi:hypothetical protein
MSLSKSQSPTSVEYRRKVQVVDKAIADVKEIFGRDLSQRREQFINDRTFAFQLDPMSKGPGDAYFIGRIRSWDYNQTFDSRKNVYDTGK